MATADTHGGSVRLSVCYARPEAVFLRELDVPAGSSIAAAIAASGVLAEFPELDPQSLRTGIFSKLKPADTVVRDGDRIEIYRPLIADPKTARRRRVQKAREEGTREGQKWMRGGGDTEAASQS